ncbi:MAG: PAS domain S-box protein [Chitinophagaceae bacterium]|nr:MAG: PAS domain S-box protein [Chitinophagaceae bacterium]
MNKINPIDKFPSELDFYKLLIEGVHDGIVVVSENLEILIVNDSFCKITGYSQSQLLGKKINLVLGLNEEQTLASKKRIELRKKGFREKYIFHLKSRDGEFKRFEVSASPVFDKNNNFIGSIGIHRDVSLEISLSQENQRLINAVNSASDIILITDIYTNILYLNQAGIKFLKLTDFKPGKYNLSKFLSKPFKNKLSEEIIPALLQNEAFKGEVNLKINNRQFKTTANINCVINNKNEIENLTIVLRDMSEYDTLVNEINLLAELSEQSNYPILRVDNKGKIEYANKASHIFFNDWGVKIGDSIPILWHKKVTKVMENRIAASFEYTHESKIFEINISPVKYQKKVNIYAFEISERKKAEMALKASENRFKAVVNGQTEMISRFYPDGTLTFVNKAYEKYFKKSEQELFGHNFINALPQKLKQKAKKELSKITFKNPKVEYEVSFTDENGKKIWQNWKNFGIFNPDCNLVEIQSVGNDITHTKLAEESLKNQLKIEDLVTGLSNKFINIEYNEIDKYINISLKKIGAFLDADRLSIFLLEKDHLIRKYTFYKDQTDATLHQEVIIDMKYYFWFLENFRKEKIFSIKNASNLPESAEKEKKLLQQLNISAIAGLPLEYEKKIIGFFTLAFCKEKQYFSTDQLKMFKVITQMISNALVKKKQQEVNRTRAKFEQIINKSAAKLINAPLEKIETEINRFIKSICNLMKFSTGFFVRYTEQRVDFTLNYQDSKNDNKIDGLLNAIENNIEYWIAKKLTDGEVLIINNLYEIPESGKLTKQLAEKFKINGFVILPIHLHKKIEGAFIFTVKDRQNEISKEIRPLFKITGQIIANAQERKLSETILREKDELYRTLAANIPDSGVLIFDKLLNIKLSEGKSLEAFDVHHELIEGKKLSKLLSSESFDILNTAFEDALNGQASIIEKKANDEYFQLQILPIKTDKKVIKTGMLISLNITRLKKIQKKLETQALNLKRSNEELEMFAYAASHDLQEPLRMISTYINLIQNKIGKNEELAEFMHFVTDGSSRMHLMINDLLEFSRIDKKNDQFTRFTLQKVIDIVNLNLKETIETTNTSIFYPKKTIEINGDFLQIVRLFQNLIENAIKFRKNNKVNINIDAKDKGEYIQFSLSDDGIGIEKRFYKKIFVMFQRLNSRKSYSGTGLGLAICKKIVERHKGEIWVESKINEGSTFYFNLIK